MRYGCVVSPVKLCKFRELFLRYRHRIRDHIPMVYLVIISGSTYQTASPVDGTSPHGLAGEKQSRKESRSKYHFRGFRCCMSNAREEDEKLERIKRVKKEIRFPKKNPAKKIR